MLNGKGRLRESTHLRYTRHKGIVIMVSPVARLFLHGSDLSYITDYNPVPC